MLCGVSPTVRLQARKSRVRPSLAEEDRRRLWEQFVAVHSETQRTFDASVRTLAAGGVVTTASLGTALHGFTHNAVLAVAFFLGSLFANVFSYWTAQMDMNTRLEGLANERSDGVDGNGWTLATTILNVLQGLAVVAAGVFLSLFIHSNAVIV